MSVQLLGDVSDRKGFNQFPEKNGLSLPISFIRHHGGSDQQEAAVFGVHQRPCAMGNLRAQRLKLAGLVGWGSNDSGVFRQNTGPAHLEDLGTRGEIHTASFHFELCELCNLILLLSQSEQLSF